MRNNNFLWYAEFPNCLLFPFYVNHYRDGPLYIGCEFGHHRTHICSRPYRTLLRVKLCAIFADYHPRYRGDNVLTMCVCVCVSVCVCLLVWHDVCPDCSTMGTLGPCFHHWCSVYGICKWSDTLWPVGRVRLFADCTISLSPLCRLIWRHWTTKCLSGICCRVCV